MKPNILCAQTGLMSAQSGVHYPRIVKVILCYSISWGACLKFLLILVEDVLMNISRQSSCAALHERFWSETGLRACFL